MHGRPSAAPPDIGSRARDAGVAPLDPEDARLVSLTEGDGARVAPLTQGDVLRVVGAHGVRVTETRHPARLRLEPHAHEHASLTCVLDGTFEETFGSESIECRPHTILFKRGRETHTDRYGPSGARCLLVEVPDHLARLVAAERCVLPASPRTDALVSLLAKELAAGDLLAPVAIEGLALELLAVVGRAGTPAGSPRPPWFAQVLEELRARFREPVSVRELATRLAVHPAQLARAFQRYEGTTLTAYVRRLRIEWAEVQLVRTERSLARIAQDAGFADQSHFTRVFSRAKGRTPGRFRDDPHAVTAVQRLGQTCSRRTD